MPGHEVIVPGSGDLALPARDALDDAVDAFAASAKSAATRRAYRADARDFIVWCAADGAQPVPAETRTVKRYLADLVARGLSVSTVDRRVAAITALHRSRGHDTPTAREDVRQVLAGIRNTHGAPSRRKKALTDDLVVKVLRKVGTDLAGLRDRAMLALCFGTALRRSKLVALDVADVEFHARGLVVTVRRSKMDQTGRGKRKGVPDGKLKVPGAVRAWLDAAGIDDGPLFRSVDRGRVGAGRMDGGSVARMVKRRCAAAGLDPKLFSGHSCRSGFATSADEHGADLEATSEHMRHAKLDTTVSYMQTGDLFRKHAGTGPVFGSILDGYKAKLAAGTDHDKLVADLAARELAVEQAEIQAQAALRTAEVGHAWEPDKLFAYVVLAFFAKVVVWDTMLGLGSTPALRGDAARWAGWIVSLYVGRRGVENAARIWRR